MASETVTLSGHIVDSLLLAKVLDTIVDAGVTYGRLAPYLHEKGFALPLQRRFQVP